MPIEFRKEFFADERDDTLNEIGKPTQRQDMVGHVTGRSPFYDDHLFDGLLHIRCHRSPHDHARIRRIDTSAAERMPGVRHPITLSATPAAYPLAPPAPDADRKWLTDLLQRTHTLPANPHF